MCKIPSRRRLLERSIRRGFELVPRVSKTIVSGRLELLGDSVKNSKIGAGSGSSSWR
jgi:hypothetical protein